MLFWFLVLTFLFLVSEGSALEGWFLVGLVALALLI